MARRPEHHMLVVGVRRLVVLGLVAFFAILCIGRSLSLGDGSDSSPRVAIGEASFRLVIVNNSWHHVTPAECRP